MILFRCVIMIGGGGLLMPPPQPSHTWTAPKEAAGHVTPHKFRDGQAVVTEIGHHIEALNAASKRTGVDLHTPTVGT